MAFTGSDRTTQEKLLRTVYMPEMRVLFNYKRILLQLLKRVTKKVNQGEKYSFPLHLGAGSGFMFSDALFTPPASVEDVDRAYFNHVGMTDKIAITADFMEDTSGAQSAETSVLPFQTRAVARNFGHDFNFFLYGDGTGTLGGVASASSGTSFVVDDARGFRNNLYVDVLLTASGDVGSGGVRNAKIYFNRSTKTVTLRDGAQLADGTGTDLNANKANYTVYKANSRNKAVYGLEAAIATGNPPTGVRKYGDIDRSDDAYDNYRGVVHHASGVARQVSYKLLYDLVSDITDRSDSMPTVALMGKELWAWWSEYLSANKRYGGNQDKLKGWARTISIDMPDGELLAVADKHCPPDRIYVLDVNTWCLAQNDEGKFASKDGSILHLSEGQIAYYASWYTRKQLVCLVPPANGVLKDLQYAAVA